MTDLDQQMDTIGAVSELAEEVGFAEIVRSLVIMSDTLANAGPAYAKELGANSSVSEETWTKVAGLMQEAYNLIQR